MDERHPHKPDDRPRTVAAGRVPPAALDAEAAVLSAMLIRPAETIAEIEPLLKPQHFYSDQNRRIYEAILEVDASGTAVDLVSVADRLRSTDRLQQVGGTPYLAQIADATPAILNVKDHAEIIVDKARLRLLIAEAQVIAAEGYGDVGPVPAYLEKAAERVFQIADGTVYDDTLVGMHDAVQAELLAITKRRERKTPFEGVSTGIDDLDKILLGMKPGRYYLLGARPGIGKTAMAQQISRAVAVQEKEGKRQGVVYVSPEMPREDIVQRHLAHVGGVPINEIRVPHKMAEKNWSRLTEAAAYVATLPIEIDDRPMQDVIGVRAAARRGLTRLRRRFDDPSLELGLVVVDYIQLLVPRDLKHANYAQLLGEISVNLRRLFRELKCVGLVLSQLNRELEKRPRRERRPQLSDLRDSGSLEQDAFGVLFIYRDDVYRDGSAEDPFDHKAEIIVAKHTQGPTGVAELEFVKETAAFVGRKDSADEWAGVGEDQDRLPPEW